MGIEKSLKEIDWNALIEGRTFHPSPGSWDDEVLYFLFVDRFSDCREYGGFRDTQGAPVNTPGDGRTTPLFDLDGDSESADRNTWFAAGKTWCGGTLAGVRDKLGYLERLGVTVIWLSPVFKQVTESDDYHGYGIQNFLDVDPHFGTREELRELVAKAHSLGIRVILDIIFNHAGDVFTYQGNHPYYYYQGRQFPVQGFRAGKNDPGSLPFQTGAGGAQSAWPNGAVWPEELQAPVAWTRQGRITRWDDFPEYIDGDFCSLKDFNHGQSIKDPDSSWDLWKRIEGFSLAPPLVHLAEVYKFWIAYADIDGYRVDTVKHMEPGAMRFFANVIHEFAQGLGKERFYLIGEVTGGRKKAVEIVNTTGLDAALGINDIPDKLEYLAKGWRNPGNPDTSDQEGYFDLFRNSLTQSKPTHQWFSRHVVTMFDDHDQVGVDHKFRFCGQHNDSHKYLRGAIALNLATAGIPCLYYGTEQAFNGADHRSGDQDKDYSDAFLRECMFGGAFGSLQSKDRHFFNEDNEFYVFTREVCTLRREHMALRRGRQYLRQVSQDGTSFHYPTMVDNELRWVVAWSRIFNNRELLCAISTDADREITVWATVDSSIYAPGDTMTCLFSTDQAQPGQQVQVDERNGSSIRITVPPAGFVVFGKT